MENPSNKKTLRSQLKKELEALSPQRRSLASAELLCSLSPLLTPYKTILSFASTPEEIDLFPLNSSLLCNHRLIFPRIEEGLLQLYSISRFPEDLIMNTWGILEPLPLPERKIPLDAIDLALIPALGFDTAYNRLGRGKGHYDRLLIQAPTLLTWGIGFKEQQLTLLPRESHDIPLKALFLF